MKIRDETSAGGQHQIDSRAAKTMYSTPPNTASNSRTVKPETLFQMDSHMVNDNCSRMKNETIFQGKVSKGCSVLLVRWD